ncbi:LuxR C-terminal-related transcriptional regulator [Paenibacillus radicis (ex Gao et al. 2016)]|uniref:HTH luxR-type domain-containing protein n=1 Tax=Paenibacillus radicis (ex Gao et al. 2016) TaxID=1737354 RepID=A0A917HLK2_9BACL|nr:LuxR C-terminal-related transcriptional regulator [Paenibacillus radicis (ex Gao et al. 2016)]GGG82621.1 hypothetical protein GCM10010918_45070 [Paenibacillus radicis (ex Gao et al. 2016)]
MLDSAILVKTKTALPLHKQGWINRGRLLEQLERGSNGKLIAVCAPAGFGKTTLVTQWLNQSNHPAVWLSIDEMDNDEMRFWRYVNQAASAILPLDGMNQLDQLASSLPGVSIRTYIDALINELYVLESPLSIVFDDFHLLTNASVYEHLAYLIEYLPQQVHLIVTSRDVLPFSTAKWLAKGQYTEINASQLSFTLDETVSYYAAYSNNNTVIPPLAERHIRKLHNRTEGWVTGLQLISLSLQTVDSFDRFIDAFTGYNRNIASYLFHEVVSQLPDRTRRFLEYTTLLPRMNASLCEALTGDTDSQEMLEQLRFKNLFILPLDDTGEWFRYHHLFSEYVQNDFKRGSSKEQWLNTHCNASQWFANEGMLDEAIDYAFAGEDYNNAERLIQRHMTKVLRQGEFATLLRWFERFPSSFALAPDMQLLYTFCLVVTGQIDKAEGMLSEVEQLVSRLPKGEEKSRLHSDILFVTSNLLFSGGSYERWFAFSQLLIGDSLPRNPLYYNFNYNLSEPLVRRTLFGLKGTLSPETEQIGLMFRNVLEGQGWEESLINLYLVQSLIEGYYEWNRLEDSRVLLPIVDRAAQQNRIPGLFVPNRLAQSMIYSAQGQHQLARDTLDEAIEQLEKPSSDADSYNTSSPHWLRQLQAGRTRIFMLEGRITSARVEVAKLGLKLQERPTFDRYYEYMTLIRLLSAQRKPSEALRLLELLLPQAFRENSLISIVEIYILQACIHYRLGHKETAKTCILEALGLGCANGYIRSFLDEGKTMAALLQRLLEENDVTTTLEDPIADYVSMLLRLLFSEETTAAPSSPGTALTLTEPLSPGELQLLELIRQGETNKRIALKLGLSEGTVKVYVSRIYGKLGVSSRTQALAAAQTLQLLEQA